MGQPRQELQNVLLGVLDSKINIGLITALEWHNALVRRCYQEQIIHHQHLKTMPG